MIWPIVILVGLVLLAVALMIFVFLRMIKKSLTRMAARRIEALIAAALVHNDKRIQILELDKALDALLAALGYRGSLGQKLIAAGARFPNIEKLWKGHKLRNVLAHEPGAVASDRDVEEMRSALHEALRHVTSAH